MNESKLPEDFVKSLLAQDGLLESEDFDAHRLSILNRLEELEKREKSSRRTTIILCGSCLLFFLVLFASSIVMLRIGRGVEPPEWVMFPIVLSVILAPVAALLLFFIYFFRYRRDLVRARREAYEQTLLALPRQINELRKDLENLREQVKSVPGGKGESSNLQKGFTLVEVMVVIAMLGILASLIIPTLSGAMSRAHSNTCKNNLRQIGKALAMYEGDFGFLPGAGDPAISANQSPWIIPSSDSWSVRIGSYLGRSSNVFLCPDYQPPLYYGGILSDSFGYNGGGSCAVYTHMSANLGLGFGKDHFVSSSALKAPSDMVAVGDLQLSPSVWFNIIGPQKTPIGSLIPIPKRHAGGANMLFADGHLEWARQAEWTDESVRSRSRWNNDHLPHPETW